MMPLRALQQKGNGLPLLAGALACIDQGVLVIDAELRLAYLNRKCCELLDLPDDLTRPGASATSVHQYLARRGLLGDGQRDVELDRLHATMLEGRRYHLDLRRPNGTYIEIIGNPIEEAGYVFTFADVTERRILQRSLEETVAERTAALVEANRELSLLASLDPLLGIINRRAFISFAEDERGRSLENGLKLAVLMVDLDRFKDINDRYGHAGGDVVLRAVAASMQAALRVGDLLARYGGEEFVILLPEAGMAVSLQMAERIRSAIATTRVTLAGNEVPISGSIGVSLVEAGDATIAVAVAKADMALYSAKRGGRNRVEASRH